MFGSEAFVAAAFTLLVCLVPESPRYLVLKGADIKARGILDKINGSAKGNEILREIKNTGEVKSEGMGNPMVQTIMMGIVNIAFTLVAIFTVEKLGRKPLLIWGSIGMAIGAAGVCLSNLVEVTPLVPVISIMVYSASFMFSWGPICWVLISEIFPNTIRSAAVAIAVAFQWIFNFIVSSSFVPLYNMRAGEMGERFGHFFVYALYGVICLIAAVFVWKLVPETKGKTLEDMSALWRRRSAKK